MLRKNILQGGSKVKRNKFRASSVTLTVFFLVSLAALSPAVRMAYYSYRESAVLAKLIATAGAEFASANVTGWVRVDDSLTGASDPEFLVWGTAAKLALPEGADRSEKWENSLARGYKLERRTGSGLTYVVLAQSIDQPEGKTISHLMISAASQDRREAGRYKQKISEALSAYGRDSRVALTYTGKTRGLREGRELLAGAMKMMEMAKAPVQEKTVTDNMVSITGYTPLLPEGISYAGSGININVALRHNQVEETTYVYAASPLILMEY